jgi:hypothetical protein
MVQHETASHAVQRAGDALDGYINGRTLHIRAGAEHFAFTGGLEMTVKLFIDRTSAERGIRYIVV